MTGKEAESIIIDEIMDAELLEDVEEDFEPHIDRGADFGIPTEDEELVELEEE